MLNNHKLKKEDDDLYALSYACVRVRVCARGSLFCVLQIKECIIVTVVAKGCVGVETR